MSSASKLRDDFRALADAATDAVADEIAALRREAARDKELRDAEHRATLAELVGVIASTRETERRLADRLATLKDGEPGRDGRDGVDGAPGISGKDGRDGTDGVPGEDGGPGADGKDGPPPSPEAIAEAVAAHLAANPPPAGKDGRDGTDGVSGRDGAPGKDGEPGVSGVDGKDGHDGVPGKDGRSFTVRGTYDATAEYLGLDVVALNGAAFVARKDDPGLCPGEGWQMIAAQGKPGRPGERGVGAKGDRGDAGPPVVAMSIDGEGLLTLTNADGSTVVCDLYPVLAKLG